MSLLAVGCGVLGGAFIGGGAKALHDEGAGSKSSYASYSLAGAFVGAVCALGIANMEPSGSAEDGFTRGGGLINAFSQNPKEWGSNDIGYATDQTIDHVTGQATDHVTGQTTKHDIDLSERVTTKPPSETVFLQP